MSKLDESPIRIKSFQFACDIVNYCDSLKQNKDYELASQLLRSGTSIGANVREAQRGVSKKDFKNKFGIALKRGRRNQILDKNIRSHRKNSAC